MAQTRIFNMNRNVCLTITEGMHAAGTDRFESRYKEHLTPSMYCINHGLVSCAAIWPTTFHFCLFLLHKMWGQKVGTHHWRQLGERSVQKWFPRSQQR
jgi:hypothetical protein